MNNEDVFLLLKGPFKYDNNFKKYYFDLYDNSLFPCKSYISIADPIYDSTFKILFGSSGAEDRLKDLINCFLFPDENEKVEKLKYVTNEFQKFDAKNNKGALRTDIACKIETKKNKFVISIEIQIWDKGDFTKRLFNYGTSLRNNISYENCCAIGISLSNNSNFVKLKKKTKNITTNLDYIQTMEINLKEELENIQRKKEIQINNKKISWKGKEYIKLFAIRLWGQKVSNRYIIPNGQIFLNEKIGECLNILSNIDEWSLEKMILDENTYLNELKLSKEEGIIEGMKKGMKKGIKEGIKEGMIKCAYEVFLTTNNTKDFYEYLKEEGININNKEEIRNILKDKDEYLVKEFINNLFTNK